MPTLIRGDIGDDVRAAQQALKNYGLAVQVDGRFADGTEAAVYIAQRNLDLERDGKYGDITRKAVASASPIATTPVFKSRIAGVPYHSQRDNKNRPGGTCNVTSLAMVLEFLGVKAQDPAAQLEDELFELLLSPAGVQKKAEAKVTGNPWTSPIMLAWLVEQKQRKDDFSDDHHLADVWHHVESKGLPAVISGKFTASGHIVVVIGRTSAGDVLVHDPYGDWQRGYGRVQNGRSRVYPKEAFEAVVNRGNGHVRAHLIST